MRNHHEKTRDMARSALPSTRRRGARQDRALAHKTERSRLRSALHELAAYDDPDDYEGELTWEARREIAWMVDDRRAGDKLGPLLHWAERIVERDPALRDAPYEAQLTYFARLLPDGLIGRHALQHLRFVLDDPTWAWWRRRSTRPEPRPSVREKVEAIVRAGRHGELNRRIRAATAPYSVRTVRTPAHRLVDDDHPAPGILVPARSVVVREPARVRLLLGAHDIDEFVKHGDLEPVHQLYAELRRDGLV